MANIHGREIDLEKLTNKELNALFDWSLEKASELPPSQTPSEWMRDNMLLHKEFRRRNPKRRTDREEA